MQPSLADKLRAEIREHEARAAEARKDLAEYLGEQERLGYSLTEVIQRQVGMGERYPTGLPTLDLHTGGGIPRGRMVMLVGKPGVGKTSLASQFVINMARHRRVAVLALFADSGMDDAAITMAQQLGVPRESALSGEPDAVSAVTRETFGMVLQLVDPDQPYDLEDVAARFVAGVPDDVAPVLLLDSVQVLRCPDPRAKTVYERVTAISNTVKAVTSRHRLVTILVSQSNRASYANATIAKDADPLAAGAAVALSSSCPTSTSSSTGRRAGRSSSIAPSPASGRPDGTWSSLSTSTGTAMSRLTPQPPRRSGRQSRTPKWRRCFRPRKRTVSVSPGATRRGCRLTVSSPCARARQRFIARPVAPSGRRDFSSRRSDRVVEGEPYGSWRRSDEG